MRPRVCRSAVKKRQEGVEGKVAQHYIRLKIKPRTHDDLDQNCGRSFTTKHPKSNRPKPSPSIITTKEFNSYTIVCRSTVAFYTGPSPLRALQGSKGSLQSIQTYSRDIFIIGTH